MVQQHNPIALEGSQFNSVHCITLPITDALVILPNAAVAEIISFSRPEPMDDAPEWILGKLSWRDYVVPLVSLEAAMGGDVSVQAKNSRIAICNTLNGNHDMPYIGVLTQGLPSLSLVREPAIMHTDRDVSEIPSIKAIVMLNEQEMIIPDLDDLEQRLHRLQLI